MRAAVREAADPLPRADAFDGSGAEEKHRIITRLVERVETGRDHEVQIWFRISVGQDLRIVA